MQIRTLKFIDELIEREVDERTQRLKKVIRNMEEHRKSKGYTDWQTDNELDIMKENAHTLRCELDKARIEMNAWKSQDWH